MTHDEVMAQVRRIVDSVIEAERAGGIKWTQFPEMPFPNSYSFCGHTANKLVLTLIRSGDRIAGTVTADSMLINLPEAVAKKIYPIHLEKEAEGGFPA